MQPFRNLRVWSTAHSLALEMYKMTTRFPDHERFGITSQLRRAAVSVASNIAEGTHRRTAVDFARFLNNAESSVAECDYLVLLGCDLGYVTEEERNRVCAAFQGLSRSLQVLRHSILERADRPLTTENGGPR